MFDSPERDETSGEAAEFDEGAWCTRCEGRLIFLGRKDFHEGTRAWGFVFGDLGELLRVARRSRCGPASRAAISSSSCRRSRPRALALALPNGYTRPAPRQMLTRYAAEAAGFGSKSSWTSASASKDKFLPVL
jgi:hypothetical protein